ncbi:AaceriAGL219Wp [[Ashbya] aceris (nom. inval.)]|nr:AaceriAGL219Wp [[Ashbya] aceris (nom. inval.)]
MIGEDEQEVIFRNVARFLTQNDLTSLALVNRWFNAKIATPQLYENIIICTDPILRSEEWYLDCGTSYIAGFRAVTKTFDQNDIFIYDRVRRLASSSHVEKIRTLVIEPHTFHDMDNGRIVLQQLLDAVIEKGAIERLYIRDAMLFEANYRRVFGLSKLLHLEITNLKDLAHISDVSVKTVKSLKFSLREPSFEAGAIPLEVKNILFLNLEELSIQDNEYSSLRVLQYFNSEGVIFPNLRALKFNHVHGLHDYNKTLRELTSLYIIKTIPLENIQRLEMEVSCCIKGCECFDNFLGELASEPLKLRELSLIEKRFGVITHLEAENWDLAVCKFVLSLPSVDVILKTLSIRHSTPRNGIMEDAVEGNYRRRRTLYAEVLPHLKALTTLIAPTILHTLSSYETLVCDLLWNGCECRFCADVLGVFDCYLMNHQYYSDAAGSYKDIIPTIFFAYAADALSRRCAPASGWDLDALKQAPFGHLWDMHGYDNIAHFPDFDCLYDVSTFVYLAICISHFLNQYMDDITSCLPSLRSCYLTGIYYSCNKSQKYKSIYE